VIVSDTGGMREMVRDGVDGFVYERANSEALAALIEQLARDPARRQSVGRLARSVVLERFTFERMVGEYQRLLR